MIGVSDTSPINYLILIELQDLLPSCSIAFSFLKLYTASCTPQRRRIQSNSFLPKARIGWRSVLRLKSIPRSESSILANEKSSRWRCQSGPNLCYSMSGRGVKRRENADSECLERLV
jgi:hypothetical protein